MLSYFLKYQYTQVTWFFLYN